MTTTLSNYGISLELPDAWYGELFRQWDGVADSGPILHFANTPVILADQDGYAGATLQAMRDGDVIVTVINLPSLPQIIGAGDAERVSPDAGWSLSDPIRTPFHGVPNDKSSLRKVFHVDQRVFDLVAFFSAPTPPSELVAAVEEILWTVRIDVAQIERGDRLEQYFNVDAAVRIQEEVRAEIWEREGPYATPQELAEHGAGGG